MKLLIDTNVIVNYLIKNEVFYDEDKKIMELVLCSDKYEFISASAITDIYYIVNKTLKNSYSVQNLISSLIKLVKIMPVTQSDIEEALRLKWKDFEDAVQYSVALSNGVDAIITHNCKDFEETLISVYSPKEFLYYISEGN